MEEQIRWSNGIQQRYYVVKMPRPTAISGHRVDAGTKAYGRKASMGKVRFEQTNCLSSTLTDNGAVTGAIPYHRRGCFTLHYGPRKEVLKDYHHEHEPFDEGENHRKQIQGRPHIASSIRRRKTCILPRSLRQETTFQ